MAAPNAQPDSPQPDDAPEPTPDDASRGPEDPGPDDDDGARQDDAPGEPALDVEAQWAGIVAELSDLERDAARGPEAAPGGADGPSPAPRDGRDVLGSVPVAPWVRASGPRDWPTTPEVEDLEEAESHFVPPDPPLVLGRDPLLTMAWALVVGVPILLLVVLVVVRPYPVIVAQVGGGAFLAGLAILLWRMPHRRDDDDEGPGAVV
ncbi:hypothetical protein JN535_05190 [Cellulosimicrobium cellulans]|uniref:hypothetical protein n=1 Tax=Cellulosimicrobium cellulans TaxID=1710 RepID=UPI00196273ED|nr:hypothetical protein [Cellulosimicrobium cellulans]MBN0039571.1 hypothetical protein [Cellulosimicrobium cellulans]